MPSDDVQIRLRMMGAALFERDAQKAARDLGNLRPAGERAARGLSRTERAAGLAQRGLRRVGAGATATIGVLRRMEVPIAAIGAGSVKLATDFQQSMEMIHTQAGASQREVDRLRGSVLNLAKTMPQSPNELAQGLFHLESIGLRGAKAMDALKTAAQGAMVGNANLEDTATALGSAWLVNIKGAGNLHRVMGLLNATVGAGNMRMEQLVQALGTGILPASKQAGLAIGDTLGALAIFTDEGYQASSAAAQMGTALHFLYNPTNKAAGALKSIGLPADQLARDMHKPRGLLRALTDLRTHLGRLKGGARGIQAEQVLGRILPGGRGRILLTLLNQLDRYRKKLDQIQGTTGRFGDAVAKSQQTAAVRIKTAWSSIQVAGIQLGSRLLPAVAPAFTAFANLVGKAGDALDHLGHKNATASIVAGIKNGIAGARTGAGGGPLSPSRRIVRGPGGRVESVQVGQISTTAKIGQKVGQILRTVATAAVSAGRQLFGALKPMQPFLANVLLPLLKGVGMGVLGSVVAAFKIAIPVIRIAATVLGQLGTWARPLRGVFQGIGMVIGFIFSGPILKGIGALGELGGAMGLVGRAARVLLIPIRVATGYIKAQIAVVRFLGGTFLRTLTFVQRFVGTFRSAPAIVLRAALNLVGGVIRTFERLPGRAASAASRTVASLANKLGSGATAIAEGAGRIGLAIVRGIIDAIKGAAGQIAGAILSIIPGPVKGVAKKVLGLFEGHAHGGTIHSPLALVGERGPELIAGAQGGRVFTASQTRSMLTMPAFLAGGSTPPRAGHHAAGARPAGPDTRPVYLVLRDGRILAEVVANAEDMAESLR